METRVQKALLNTAVCLYAVFGFSLSVLTSFLGLLGARQPSRPMSINIPPLKPHHQPVVPRNRPVNRTLRTCSDKSSPAVLAKFTEPTLEDKLRRRKLLAAHRRSRSIPLITLDYFGSTEKLPRLDSDVEPLPVRKPLTFVLPPPPGRERGEPPWSAGYDSEKSGFKLANLFSKEKKREKENMQKVRERRPSAPASPQQPDEQAQAPRKLPKSQVSKYAPLSKEGPEKVVRAPMRRVSSAPTEERLSMRFDLTFSRTVEKKKSSSTLRTQPYEAPFFCPPPVQPVRRKTQGTLELTPKPLNKPSRTSTINI